jgi:hypothetical protein
VRTRSKAGLHPYEWTMVPILVKIFKVIIYELANDIEAVNAAQDTETVNSVHTFTHIVFFL